MTRLFRLWLTLFAFGLRVARDDAGWAWMLWRMPLLAWAPIEALWRFRHALSRPKPPLTP